MHANQLTRKDILTPANAITLLGLILVIIGCFYLDQTLGLILVMIGRSMDLLDGPVARATNTTKFSVIWDPMADKIAMVSIIVSVLILGLAPWFVAVYIVLQNLSTAILATQAYKRQQKAGAMIPGKLNMFFQMLTIFFFIGSHVVSSSSLSHTLHTLAYASFIISLPLAVMTAKTYIVTLQKGR